VSPSNPGVTNWPPPAYSPQTGLFYVPAHETYSMYYLTETDPRGSMGLGGNDEQIVGSTGSSIEAIDYRTGNIMWKHTFASAGRFGYGTGLLATAGGLVFGGDVEGNLVALDASKGNPLWHSRLGQVTNAPETYTLDGHQYVIVAAGDLIFAFGLY
jgi:alcohol dehydrogenase (cytochrome c)